MHAEKCPVCDGSGKYCVRNEMQRINDKIGFKRHEETCHGCGGKGWVEVRNSECEWTISTPWATSAPSFETGDSPNQEPTTTY
jgi:DnaJ-class molecular chaperone